MPQNKDSPITRSQYIKHPMGKLKESSVCRDFRHTAEDGEEYQAKFYSPDIHINETLTCLRDTLLPKLMSREVRVKLEEEEAVYE